MQRGIVRLRLKRKTKLIQNRIGDLHRIDFGVEELQNVRHKTRSNMVSNVLTVVILPKILAVVREV